MSKELDATFWWYNCTKCYGGGHIWHNYGESFTCGNCEKVTKVGSRPEADFWYHETNGEETIRIFRRQSRRETTETIFGPFTSYNMASSHADILWHHRRHAIDASIRKLYALKNGPLCEE